ncbi:MAG TPA: lasso RiPP family leader peptide-containing protein [Anaerolineaceae bacterium]|nr:lasso RiPP family leader peptide-containing protein [Anaerolineaceae bacterium]HPN53470.1 lasso RiPP family leader peptide-containing protein [Anaerolineaceae bacterium]
MEKYETPELIEFGNVDDITLGEGSNPEDGLSGSQPF